MTSLTPEKIAQSQGRLSEVQANHTGVYWLEQRPAEKGRMVLMHWAGEGKPICLTPEGENVDSRVNEYGGGSYYLGEDKIYYPPSRKHGDATFGNNRFIYVQETPDSQSLVEVSTTGEILRTIHDKHDFYAAPRLNPQTDELAFIAWDLPSMPWDHTKLNVIASAKREAIHHLPDKSFKSQPTWHNGELYFISDHTNFGQLYHYHENRIEPVCENWPDKADAAMPLWTLGMQTFLPIGEHRFAIIYSLNGWYHLGIIDHGRLQQLELPFCAYGDQLALWQNYLAFSAATPTEGFAIRLLDLRTGTYQTISEIAAPLLAADEISLPEPIHYPTSNNETAHAFFYRPKNPNPPLLVMSHGGPTFYTNAAYSNKIQFWTQNGFAVVDVNYRGSTGYGRQYWEALKHAWGEADAKDCIDAAEYAVKQGWVNPDQLFIRGSSAGGFLSLCAMASTDIFKAAAIYYGVSNLNAFMEETHRFESGYNDWLVGKTVVSPVDQLEKYTKPIIFFHGLKDTVVPVSHSEVLFKALQENHVYTELHTYPEEGHSFRAASTVIDSLTKELNFFKRFL
jgi:dienelactone hydrolase